MVLIGHMMSGWQAAGLGVVYLGVIQAFTCSIERGPQGSFFSAGFFGGVFLRFTSVGYAVALLLSFYVLWTFGRLDGLATAEVVEAMLVLGFPAALGASAARLIL